MRHALVVGSLLVVTFIGVNAACWAQQENLSVGRFVGVGTRFLPSVLMPVGPSNVDLALSTAITGQCWISDLLAVEVGGWMSGFSDAWNPNSFTSLSGGLLLKLSDNAQDDLYLAGRAISVQSVYRNYCCIYREGESPAEAQQDKIMPPYPWPSYESRTSILAFEITAGIERSWSAQVTTNFEFGFIYAQTMTTNLPPPESSSEEAVSLPKPETVAATSFGITVHISVNFYPPRK